MSFGMSSAVFCCVFFFYPACRVLNKSTVISFDRLITLYCFSYRGNPCIVSLSTECVNIRKVGRYYLIDNSCLHSIGNYFYL